MVPGAPPEPAAPPRDSSTAPNRLPMPDPARIGLPRARRNYVLPAVLALAAFVIIMAARLIWG